MRPRKDLRHWQTAYPYINPPLVNSTLMFLLFSFQSIIPVRTHHLQHLCNPMPPFRDWLGGWSPISALRPDALWSIASQGQHITDHGAAWLSNLLRNMGRVKDTVRNACFPLIQSVLSHHHIMFSVNAINHLRGIASSHNLALTLAHTLFNLEPPGQK